MCIRRIRVPIENMIYGHPSFYAIIWKGRGVEMRTGSFFFLMFICATNHIYIINDDSKNHKENDT